jgi:hypothetical protein
MKAEERRPHLQSARKAAGAHAVSLRPRLAHDQPSFANTRSPAERLVSCQQWESRTLGRAEVVCGVGVPWDTAALL